MLASLHGSPSTPDRRRSYIDTIIHFMGQKFIRVAALRAAWSIRIASMGQSNKSLRERLSEALAECAVLSDAMQTSLDNKPVKESSAFNWNHDT